MFRSTLLVLVIVSLAYWLLWHPSTSHLRGTPTVIVNPYVASTDDGASDSSGWSESHWKFIGLGCVVVVMIATAMIDLQRRLRRHESLNYVAAPADDVVPLYEPESDLCRRPDA